MRLTKRVYFWGAESVLLLFILFSCKQNTTVTYVSQNYKGEDYRLALNDSSIIEDWIYDVKQNKLAIWNSSIYSIDIYNLDSRSFENRIFLSEEGPYGIGNVESIAFLDSGITAIDPIKKVRLNISFETNKKEIIRLVNLENQKTLADYNFNIVHEFSSKPKIDSNHSVWPITPKEDFLSKEYYSHDVLLVDDSKTVGTWPNSYQKYYYGLLGEPSLSYSEKLIFLSFPIDERITVFDYQGKEQSGFMLSSSEFRTFRGMDRQNPDLQKESNMTITETWFLKTIYHENKLIRFEKEAQDLKDVEGKLNSKLFGKWKIIWKNLSGNDTIFTMGLPEKELFLPISFPYKNGVLIKKINDENEDFADFVYINLDAI
jgi:hypothetical protein